MTPAQYNRLRLAYHAWRLPFRGRGGVLLYHRIAELEHDPWSLAIGPADFADHLAILERQCVCLSLPELLSRRAAGTLPANAVAVTFDDGYADNLEAALPLLERHGIPATIFVLSGFVGGSAETWWDRLEQTVFGAPALPGEIDLPVGQARLLWSRPRMGPGYGMRVMLHRKVYAAVALVDTAERETALAELARQMGYVPAHRATHRALTVAELQKLAASPLITVGGHTRTHPFLRNIAPERQRAEIAGGKADLEAWLERPIEHFAYPHGSYGTETPAIVAEVGFTWAFTTKPTVVRADSDPMRISRLNILDLDGQAFAETLWWHGLSRKGSRSASRAAPARSGS
jgi:peptidoglycan/xylan/chitin deacetylase (PgdA/CDA1 family)